MNRIYCRSLIAVAAFALTGCAASHGTSPQGLEVPIEKAALKFAADTKANAYKVVTTEELKKWFDEKKQMTIISALPAEEDASFGKLPGAVNGMIPKTEKELTPRTRSGSSKPAAATRAGRSSSTAVLSPAAEATSARRSSRKTASPTSIATGRHHRLEGDGVPAPQVTRCERTRCAALRP